MLLNIGALKRHQGVPNLLDVLKCGIIQDCIGTNELSQTGGDGF